MAIRDDWILRLESSDIAELDAALSHVKAARIGIPELSSKDFVIPRLAAKLEAALDAIENGIGFVLIRGFPVDQYSKADAALVFWGIGAHFGPAFAQNAQGDVLGHVRDVGVDYRVEMRARGYQTNARLPFHSDSTDVVGLLCLNKAKSGGSSRIVSSTAIHNEFLSRRPDLLQVMYEPFYFDRRGEEAEGQKPYYATPCFNFFNDRLLVRYNQTYMKSAQRFPDVARMSDKQVEAIEMMNALCNDPAFNLEMVFEPGDMQFLCNYVILHSRDEYEDHPEAERKRHLLRLWLRTPGFKELPPALAVRNLDMLAWQRNPKKPVFEVFQNDGELAH
jgi:hypothetical protein